MNGPATPGAVDHVRRSGETGARPAGLARDPPLLAPAVAAVSRATEVESRIASGGTATGTEEPGPPSGLTCPDRGAALLELADRRVPRFRRRAGHAFTIASLPAARPEAREDAPWSAVGPLEEEVALRCGV